MRERKKNTAEKKQKKNSKLNCCIYATSINIKLDYWLLEASKEHDGFVVIYKQRFPIR